MLYKITNSLVDINKETYLHSAAIRSTRGSHNLKYHTYQVNTDIFRNSFFPRSIQEWNHLPSHIVNSPTLDTFRNRIISHYNPSLNLVPSPAPWSFPPHNPRILCRPWAALCGSHSEILRFSGSVCHVVGVCGCVQCSLLWCVWYCGFVCCILDRYRQQSHPVSSDNSRELSDVRTVTWPGGPCPHGEGLILKDGCPGVFRAAVCCPWVIGWIRELFVYECGYGG